MTAPGAGGRPVDFIRANPEMVFPDGRASAQMCIQQLFNEVLTLGGTDARIQRLDGWWLLWSSFDWFMGIDHRDIFERMHSLPSAGELSGRCEIVLAAFTESLATWGAAGGQLVIQGSEPSAAVWEEMRRGTRAVAFRFASE